MHKKVKDQQHNHHQETMSLYDAACQLQYELVSVPAMALLDSLGIRKPFQLYKKYRYRFGGPVLVRVDHSDVAIGKEIASQIIVKEVT